MDVAVELSSARTIAGLSVRELARRSGVAHSQILRIERGESDPSVGTLEALLGACGRGLVVVDGSSLGSIKASRLKAGVLTPSEALTRYAAAILEAAAMWGVDEVRQIPWAAIVESSPVEVDEDDVEEDEVVLLLSGSARMRERMVLPHLTGEFGRLLGWPVQLFYDEPGDERFEFLRGQAVSIRS